MSADESTRNLLAVIAKHTGQTEDEAHALVARAFDRLTPPADHDEATT